MNKEDENKTIKKADDRHIWDKLEEAEKKIKEGFKAVITEVEEMTNEKYFGTSGYDERDGIKVTVKVETDEVFDVWYSKPSIRGIEKSNLYAFKQKYGSYPKPDLEVNAVIGDNGFFQIEID